MKLKAFDNSIRDIAYSAFIVHSSIAYARRNSLIYSMHVNVFTMNSFINFEVYFLYMSYQKQGYITMHLEVYRVCFLFLMCCT